jgi:N-acetylneuraminic acid mutarotase
MAIAAVRAVARAAAAVVGDATDATVGMRAANPLLDRRGVLAVIAGLVPLAACGVAGQPQAPWARGAPMPTARSELASAALGERIYVAGGIAQLGTTTAFEAYDPGDDSWEELAPLPEDLHHLAAAAAGGRVYATGGYADIAFSEKSRRSWVYDPGVLQWTRAADLPAPRAAHAMAAIDGKLFVVGGVGPRAEELWVYDATTDRWEAARAPLPTPREHLAAAAIDGRLYVVGGRGPGAGNRATLEIYDPPGDAWTRGPDMPTARGGLTAAALEGRVHVTGGEDLDTGATFAEHEVYDPASSRWTTLAPLPTARHGLTSQVIDRRWYVIGGGARAGAMTFISLTDLVEIFTPAPGAK